MVSFNLANRLALVKDGNGTGPGADIAERCGTNGGRLVAIWSEATGEGGDSDSTMVE